MLNIDLEPLKELYQEILQTQAVSEKELKALKYLIDKLQETKEEFENSSFVVLKKNTELFKKTDNILHNIQKLSNMLLQLENKIEKEKINFDKDIKEKLKNLDKELTNAHISLQRKKDYILDVVLNITNKFKNLEKDLEKINEKYQEAVVKNINEFNNQLEEYVNEFEEEIKQKTFFARWGAVFIALGVGLIAGILIVFVKFKDDIIFSAKYSNTCYINKKYRKCYIVPIQKVFDGNNDSVLILKK